MPNCNFNKIAKQIYWNRILIWMFSSKFAAYFRITFSKEDLRMTASGFSGDLRTIVILRLKKYQSVLQNCYLSTQFVLFQFLMLEWRYWKVIMTLKFYSKCPNQPSFNLISLILMHIFCWNVLMAEFFFSYINLLQTQPSIVVLRRRFFENMLQIYRRKVTFLKSYPS